MKISNQKVIFLLATSILIFAILDQHRVECSKIRENYSEEEEEIPVKKNEEYQAAIAENKKFRVVLKIIKAYLKDQINQLDRLTEEDIG